MPYAPDQEAEPTATPASGSVPDDCPETINPFLQFVEPERYWELVRQAQSHGQSSRFVSPSRIVSKLTLVGTLSDD